MKKLLTITTVFTFLLNTTAPAALYAQTGVDYKANRAYELKIVENLYNSTKEQLSHPMRDLLRERGMEKVTQKNAHLKLKNTEQFKTMAAGQQKVIYNLNQLHKTSYTWAEIDMEFKRLAGPNSIEYKLFRNYDIKFYDTWRTVPNDPFCLWEAETVAEFAAKEGTYLKNNFVQLVEHMNSDYHTNSNVKRDITSRRIVIDQAKKLLKYKTFPEAVKAMFPDLKGPQLEHMTRLTRAYLENVASKSNLLAEEIKLRNDHLGRKGTKGATELHKNSQEVRSAQRTTKILTETTTNDATQKTIMSAIQSRATSPRLKLFLNRLGATGTNIVIIGGFTLFGLVVSSNANASNDAALKQDINNFTAQTIKNQNEIIKLVKETPEALPLLPQKQIDAVMERQDVLTDTQKLTAAINYKIFMLQLERDPAAMRAKLEAMEKEDMRFMAQSLNTDVFNSALAQEKVEGIKNEVSFLNLAVNTL
ncbi:hypothetical protein Dip510_000113 [Elusimicrobium posterum]|uniref:hypothetical protein n=1 Tax=Elusimicrobium posterum TaxID=3116653 RepID=UPI003C791E0C